MDTLDGSYLKSSSRSTRQQTRSSAAMPPPAQPPAHFIHKSPTPSELSYRAGAYFPNSTMLSPTGSSDTLNSTNVFHSTQIITTNAIPNLSTDESIMSYQRVKKVVNTSVGSIDAELRAKEDYVAHLKSLDMSKFSFPNENKPKTDYTYARTGSYRASELSNDQEEVMPNLCRRARRSPPHVYSSTNHHHASAASSFLSPVGLLRYAGSAGTQNVSAGLSKLNSSIHSVCSYFSSVVSSTSRRPNSAVAGNVELSNEELVNAKSLNRRLEFELCQEKAKMLDEEAAAAAAGRRETRSSSTLKKLAILTNLYGLDRDSPPPSVVPSAQQAPASSPKKPAGNASLARGVNRSEANAPVPDDRSSPAQSAGHASRSSTSVESVEITRTTIEERPPTPPRRSRTGGLLGGCGWLLIVLLLLLLPIAYMFVQNSEAAKSQFYQAGASAYHDYAEPAWHYARDSGAHFFGWLRGLFGAIPSTFACFLGYFKCKESAVISLSGGDQQLESMFNEMKQKILAEISQNFQSLKDQELKELVVKHLDEFNKTLTIPSSRADEMKPQVEPPKPTSDELNQLKSTLLKLQADYQALFVKLEQQNEKERQQQEKLEKTEKTAQRAIEAAEAAKMQIKSQSEAAPPPPSQPPASHTYLDKNLSFREIEEYINRTLYLYNADKTGKTDFASESVGGSVLFTRCTETYMEGARWFTVFDVPITRITVSPRVVIQGTMQPGNCWAFKGSKADLFIKLAARIKPTSFSIEHIPKELSITGNIDSAPQNFTVYGYTNKEEISDDKRYLLGSYRYDNNSKSPLQFFEAMHFYNVPIGVIELKIESNAGNKDYTCLYKFRVHGELFKASAGAAEAGEGQPGDKPPIGTEAQPSAASKLINDN